MKKILLPLALMSALLVSCEKPENKEPEPEYAISVSPTEITFGVEGGDAEVTITITNSDEWRVWRISSMPDWIEITEQYGENGATITVTAKEYNAEAESRSGEIVFIYENKDAKVSVTQKADESPIIQFKDPKFLEELLRNDVDRNGDGQISEKEAMLVETLYISGDIRNLEEIKYFTALTSLNYNNQLTSLDVSKNTALTELWCDDNQLTSLDVSKNTALTYLSCDNNQLTSLDVSKNTALTELWCDNNQLTSLDVSKNTALTELHCSNNQPTSLDVSKNTALTYLNCYNYNNQLTSLDVSKNTALTELWCDDNQLTSLDVSNNTALTKLSCCNNQLTSLDVSKNIALIYLWCYDNQLTSLDLHNNRLLEYLYISNNPLQKLILYKYHIIDDSDMEDIESEYGDIVEYVE